MSLERFVQHATGLISGNVIQLSSMGFTAFGIAFDLELIGVMAGVFMAFIGLMISWRSSLLQKKVHQKELEKLEKEMEMQRIEELVFKKEHPELFEKDGK